MRRVREENSALDCTVGRRWRAPGDFERSPSNHPRFAGISNRCGGAAMRRRPRLALASLASFAALLAAVASSGCAAPPAGADAAGEDSEPGAVSQAMCILGPLRPGVVGTLGVPPYPPPYAFTGTA